MTDKFYLEEAIEDLHTLLDMTRWATSRFNDAALYFGHGTDNAWDEATSLVMQALHLPHPILEQVGDSVMTSRLTKSEREKIAELVLKRVQTRILRYAVLRRRASAHSSVSIC